MIIVRNKATGEQIGTLTTMQLQFLMDQMEEESSTDQDYWVSRDEVDIFKEQGADPELIAMLEQALGDADDMDIEWEVVS